MYQDLNLIPPLNVCRTDKMQGVESEYDRSFRFKCSVRISIITRHFTIETPPPFAYSEANVLVSNVQYFSTDGICTFSSGECG